MKVNQSVDPLNKITAHVPRDISADRAFFKNEGEAPLPKAYRIETAIQKPSSDSKYQQYKHGAQ